MSDNEYVIAYDEYGNVYLAHHGIKGQRWGVRRYQNEDGSLTDAGQRRYNTDTAGSATKSLNKIEKVNAKLKTKAAIADIKAQKAYNKNKDKKYEKYKSISDEAKDAVDAGEKLSKKLVNDAKKANMKVSSIDKTRYTHIGRQVIAGPILAGIPGNIAVTALDAYRAYNYGPEAGGIVKGKKYSVNRG